MRITIGVILLITICHSMVAQGQKILLGDRFELFKNTTLWELAQNVEKEDNSSMKSILKSKKLNINLRESKYGQTLLHLAILNGKVNSVSFLLKNGAKVNVPDFQNRRPIHEATEYINNRINAFEIIQSLIKYGANVNDTLIIKQKYRGNYVYVPLMGASKNLKCAKLLLENGANPYFKYKETYDIWDIYNQSVDDEVIYFIGYLIVDKMMPIPNPIYYNGDEKTPISIYDILQSFRVEQGSPKDKERQRILNYLNEIQFPKNGVFVESKR